MDTNQRLEFLWNRWTEKTATPVELHELMGLLKQSENDPLSLRMLDEYLSGGMMAPVHRIPFWQRPFLKYAAAVILLFGAGTYFFLNSNKSSVKENQPISQTQTDRAPGTNRATLKLSNGSTILLDSARNGLLTSQSNTKVFKTDSGRLSYVADNAKNIEVSYNTLTTPRGGIFQLTLPDGTKAWLNAASSITYPTRFTADVRKVTMTGEVYFEVAKDAAHPFIVESPAMQIEVLGTHFNVNAYTDEDSDPERTTLLEGSVKVSANNTSKTIRPGEQAFLFKNSPVINIDQHANLEKVMAWQSGRMSLNSVTVTQIMREISRWYDVDIEYKGAVPEGKFYGSVNRQVQLSTLLHVLEAYGIKTKLEGKKLIVL